MTGMLNRESFFAVLDGSRRKSDRGALLIIDADHFKKINDSYGHLTGDKALLEIAAAISAARARRRRARPHRRRGVRRVPHRSERRGGDARRRAHPPRGGGDPLPAGRWKAAAADGVDRRHALQAEANVSELMHAADKRPYEAKGRGRNRAIFDDGMPAAA